MDSIVTNALFLWIFVSVGFLPRYIHSVQTLALIVIGVGGALAWASDVMIQRPSYYLPLVILIVAVATLFSIAHSEIIFYRKTGFWRALKRSGKESQV